MGFKPISMRRRHDAGAELVVIGKPIEPERARFGWIAVLVVAILIGRFVASLLIR